MHRYFLIILVFIISSCGTPKMSQQEFEKRLEAYKPPKSELGAPPIKEELIGFWQMIELPNSKVLNKTNPWPLPYQWFYFDDKGIVYSYMASENDESITAAELAKVFELFQSEKVPNYKLLSQFILIDNPEIKNYREVWGANLFAKDNGDVIKKGDLLMTLEGGKEIVYYRLLRRIK